MASTEDLATSAKTPRGGQYCVAGWPKGKSFTNSQHTDGVSIHRFPMKGKDNK